MINETFFVKTLVQQIDISSMNACLPSDVVWASSSLTTKVKHLYITERGVDNDTDRLANDGKVYEISLDPAECGHLSQNLLRNPGFERDCTNISFPDKWTVDNHFTRSAEVIHGGDFAGKHFATDDSSYTIQQIANNLTAGALLASQGSVNSVPDVVCTRSPLRPQYQTRPCSSK